MAEVTLSTVVNLDLVKMKWKEQYVSEGLNRKVAPTQPAGIYQGLRMIENLGSPRQVELSPDVDTGYHMAVYQSTTGYSLTYWDLAGTAIILDLSSASLDSTDVVIGLEMDYTIGVDTVAEWKAFPLADWNALPLSRKNEIIVLGTIAVPAAATNITTAMISFERATMAWRNISKGAIGWSQIVRNGDFEQSEVGTENAWWWTLSVGGDGQAIVRQADPFRNDKYISMLSLGTNPIGVTATQNVGVPVIPAQLGMVKLFKKNLEVPTGTMSLDLIFTDLDGIELAALSIDIPVIGVDASYQEVLEIFEVPATATVLKKVVIVNNATYSGAGNKVLIDDINVWLETEGERNDLQHGASGDLEVMGRLAMRDPDGLYDAQSLEVNYDSAGNQLNIDDRTSSGGLDVDINGDLIASNLTADTSIVATAGNITATAGNITAGADMSVAGEILSTLIPDVTGKDLGSGTNRWDAFVGDLDVTQVIAALLPNASGLDLGSLANRWDLFAAALDVSGEIKHGDRELILNAAGGLAIEDTGILTGTWSEVVDMYTGHFICANATTSISHTLPLIVGDRIKSVEGTYSGASTASKRLRLRSVNNADGVNTNHNTVTHGTTGWQTRALTISPQLTVVSGRSYYVLCELATNGDLFASWKITYDHP